MLRLLALCTALCACALWPGPAAAALFLFNNGTPDGRAGLASRPGVGGQMEIEAADDFFVFNTGTTIATAIFTGLLPAGTPLGNVNFVGVAIYRIFPADSAAFANMV